MRARMATAEFFRVLGVACVLSIGTGAVIWHLPKEKKEIVTRHKGSVFAAYAAHGEPWAIIVIRAKESGAFTPSLVPARLVEEIIESYARNKSADVIDVAFEGSRVFERALAAYKPLTPYFMKEGRVMQATARRQTNTLEYKFETATR